VAGRTSDLVRNVSRVFRVATYRLRATFGRRWTGYLAIVLLIALLGGLAMGSIAAARRTQSSFPTFLASTNPSALYVPTASWQPGSPNSAGTDPSVTPSLLRLPRVRGAEDEYSINAQPVGRNGYPVPSPNKGGSLGISILNDDGSIDGELSDQDRLTAISGRLADPKRANEIDVSSVVAQALRVHVGEIVPIGFYTNAQTTLPGYGTGSATFKAKAHLRMDMKVVGIVAFNNQVVLDSLDATNTAQIVYTPALTRRLIQCCISSTTTYLRLAHGVNDIATVEREITRVHPGIPIPFGVESSTDVAERAIKPESIALGVFGGIAALATLLVAGQAISRQLRQRAEEGRTLRALGASPAMTMGDGLMGTIISVVVGSLLAVVVAVGLSPLAPIGVVRPVYPDRGIAFDWTALGLGLLVLIVVLSTVAVAVAYRQAPHRAGISRDRDPKGPSSVTRAAGRYGLPAPAVEGIRFSLDPGAGRNSVPVRSAIVGTTLAIVVVIATVTFGASLDTLISHPPLYGWNWNYELTGGGGIAPVPGQKAADLLDHDRSVAAWSGVSFGATASLDGQIVPVLGQGAHATVGPPLLSGHGLNASNQVVLGGATLSALHRRIGDTIEVDVSGAKPERLQIVGTATMPTIGAQLGEEHPTMGTGALVSSALLPASATNPNYVIPTGPSAVLVRFRSGADPAAALRSLRRIANELTLPSNYGVTLLNVQRPAEIINYRSMGTIPAILGLGLAVGAALALGLTLLASVRRRRRDLALFKTLGFTGRQLAAVVAWQSSIAVGIGTVMGVPLGIIFGRVLWNLFARAINAVPQPSVPAWTVVLVAAGALVLANVVAAFPARVAARTPTALLLRAE
jgi:ABC-type antimicrobial peptide transport system permease subunit